MHNLYALSITAVTKWITEISLETAKAVACVAWRFFREHYAKRARTSLEYYAKTRAKARANDFVPISSRFLGPRPPDRAPILLSAPNQNRRATQATKADVLRLVLLSCRQKPRSLIVHHQYRLLGKPSRAK